jgi:shikimate dehydrogenase
MRHHYGLIGRKLGHSFSRNYFTDKFLREGINAEYSLIEIDDIAEIRDVIEGDEHLRGLNVTIPYKESILPYLDELTPEAEEIGAVNCVTIKSSYLKGYNTDVEGIELSLNMLNLEPNCKALIFGTGGACKAVSYILRRRGIEYLTVSRSAANGDITYDNLTSDIIAEHRLLVNTTPLGMFPDIDSAPQIDYSAIGSSHSIFDLVYNPEPTLFMQRCIERGASVIGGSAMLRCQAEASWRIWNL